MCNNRNKYTYLIEVVVPPSSATQTTIGLTAQEFLRDKYITGLETYCREDIALSPQGNALVTGAQLTSSYITLYTAGQDLVMNSQGIWVQNPQSDAGAGQWMQQLPLATLHYLQNSATIPYERNKFDLAGQSIYWEKVIITLGAALGNTSANASFLINVSYEFVKPVYN